MSSHRDDTLGYDSVNDPYCPYTKSAKFKRHMQRMRRAEAAAQGAAMAIEDAAVLAMLVDRHGDDLPAALAAYERQRRPRIARVARRGAFNRFTWHAAGPIAIGRNVVAGMLSPRRHATDLDWLYGWDASTAE